MEATQKLNRKKTNFWSRAYLLTLLLLMADVAAVKCTKVNWRRTQLTSSADSHSEIEILKFNPRATPKKKSSSGNNNRNKGSQCCNLLTLCKLTLFFLHIFFFGRENVFFFWSTGFSGLQFK